MTTFKIRALSCFLFAFLIFDGNAIASSVRDDLPKGWRSPSTKQLSQDFRRKDRNHFALAIGDFNGDGIEDRAALLVDETNSKLGLFVCLRNANGCNWQLLEEMDIVLLEAMGIATVKLGEYKTACGKGYWECDKDEPSTLVLKRQAIEFFNTESASSNYVYDPRNAKFTAIAISD
jgi:hypothetical protein